MDVRLELNGVPAAGLRLIYPEAEWLTSPDGSTETTLVRSMEQLNRLVVMDRELDHGRGCCKLVLPADARVGRAILAFAPVWQVWCKQDPESLAYHSVISGWLVVLDESGELRTPPNHSYSDAEESSIQQVLRANLRWMVEEDWAVSPTFLRLLGMEERAQEVQAALEVWEGRKRKRKTARLAAAASSASASASATLPGAAAPQ